MREPMLLTMSGCEGPRDGFRLRLSDPTLGHVLPTNSYHGSEDSEEESSTVSIRNNWLNSAIPVSFTKIALFYVCLLLDCFPQKQNKRNSWQCKKSEKGI